MAMEVLDFGSVDYIDHMGNDLTVCNAARVSFNKETEWERDTEAEQRLIDSKSSYRAEDLHKLSNKDCKLIEYLADHNHWTPFAHPQITLRIKAPISIRTQFFKHKQGFVENEISRRYVNDKPSWYHPEWRAAPTGFAKQGSDGLLDYDKERLDGIDAHYHFAVTDCIHAYEALLEAGVAPEQARFVLPQGCYTEWYWTGSLAAYARFYKQRSDPHAQWEIQQYARAVGNIIRPLFPLSWNALTKEN